MNSNSQKATNFVPSSLLIISVVSLLLLLCPLRLHHLSKSYDQAYSRAKGSQYILYTRFININRARMPPSKHKPTKAPGRLIGLVHLTIILLLAGDVEANPGPTSMDMSSLETQHPG